MAGLLDTVAERAAALLGMADLGHRSARIDVAAARHLAGLVFETIGENWQMLGAEAQVARSAQNWRWYEPVTDYASHNGSKEVVLERKLAEAAYASGEERWSNQVPVASGLVGSGDRRRAIDLVAMPAPDHAVFVELKIASDTPAYAAVELLGYASLWLLTRAAPARPQRLLLDATHVDLVVLAPAAFYRNMPAGFGPAIDAGVRTLGTQHGVSLSFAFATLDPHLLADPLPDTRMLIDALDASVPVARRR